ncbi:hypothetical protein [Candidatus Reidiella endopervernicosa]|uniref:Uncharacterized protein n=1 Tax=Candidatus Reidiella endopervernicosa TaxID=2738883 RepID=A0A6N0HYX4_9GAMM|nr:hypothetical protein [Candidatus Reidiella endopervernicosa]QKQ27487.1 hypothetical protein HUE57_15250 [Candidatus Reidiella endopervernicosa]
MSRDSSTRSIVEKEAFITLLRVACDDPEVYGWLEKILLLGDEQRLALLRSAVLKMQIDGAPEDYIDALTSLEDSEIAEKVYEVIFKCQRNIPLNH